jgi:hypothetical protein
MLAGLQKGNEVLKELQKEMNIDKVMKLMDDTQDAIEYQNVRMSYRNAMAVVTVPPAFSRRVALYLYHSVLWLLLIGDILSGNRRTIKWKNIRCGYGRD